MWQYSVNDEMVEKQRETTKKQVCNFALLEYKQKLLKMIEKEKKAAEKSSQKLREILSNNPSKAQRTSATAKCNTKWEHIRYLELQVELLDELLEENKKS
ncbi:hypothetical protein [Brachyspira hampsonii]|uniref:Uncharacterized protein n=1 Tax=Brachyspira hampsonii TaxID=1287055 RepID=A0AAC9XKX8_9SPIR|nr:hypothetical protein [Brachyspira hampsonii]ASJ21763.1 hypothetical protein BHAMNSH16_08955 [Brachyspira hampsonii]ELV06166.1 hypothetical protein H263_05842 [Brachyspira hampsonii 30599]MBW5380736.1 hypothetical protein [Brachyspira hampsonii]OEJ18782.1 hypothetical protein A9496_06125 [Brachyspira hampsonii]